MRFNLGAWVTDDFDLQFAYDQSVDHSGVRGARMLTANPFDALLTPTTGPFLPLSSRYDVRNGMPNVNDTTMRGASVTANLRSGEDWTFKYVAAKRESDTETNIDFDTTPLTLVDVRAFYSDSQVSQELQANYDGGGRARGVMGLYWFNGDAGGQVLNHFYNPLLATGLTNPLFGDTQGVVNTKSIALYADWTFDLTDRLTLDVGARYTDEDKHAVALNRFYTGLDYGTSWGTAANFDKTINFKNVSPKVSLDYQVTPDILVYGLASRGFKSGGYNIRANTTAVPRSGEPFDDEQVDSFEIGSKMSFLDQRLFLNLSAFHNKYKDIQLSIFTAFDSNNDGVDDNFFGDFTNAGKGTVNGVEVEYQFLPTANWLVSGNLAWLDAKYDEFLTYTTTRPPVLVDVADSQYFTNAPEFSGAINVEYRTDLANGGNLSARVGYSYQSEVWPTTDLSPLIKQDGYGLVSAGVIWKIDDAWSLSLQGTNLADEEYRTTGYNIAAYGVLTGFYGPPRQYSLTARYDF